MAALVPLKRLRSNAIAARAPKSELLYFTTIAKLCAHYRHLYMADDIAHLYMADDIAPLSLWIYACYYSDDVNTHFNWLLHPVYSPNEDAQQYIHHTIALSHLHITAIKITVALANDCHIHRKIAEYSCNLSIHGTGIVELLSFQQIAQTTAR
jgi:hypothetical protein